VIDRSTAGVLVLGAVSRRIRLSQAGEGADAGSAQAISCVMTPTKCPITFYRNVRPEEKCNGTSKVSVGGCASESASCSGIGGGARKGGEKGQKRLVKTKKVT
jgi:hypothetical protein